MEFQRLERGIAHFYSSQQAFDEAAEGVELMRRYGVQRRLVSREELLKIEPAFTPYADHIAGGTFTETDESGDARIFTEKLAQLCAGAGVDFLYQQDILSLQPARSGKAASVQIRSTTGGAARMLSADAVVGLRLLHALAAGAAGCESTDLPWQGL